MSVFILMVQESFWAIQLNPDTFTVTSKWGKLEDPGMLARNEFATLEEAQKFVAKKIKEKTRRGYA